MYPFWCLVTPPPPPGTPLDIMSSISSKHVVCQWFRRHASVFIAQLSGKLQCQCLSVILDRCFWLFYLSPDNINYVASCRSIWLMIRFISLSQGLGSFIILTFTFSRISRDNHGSPWLMLGLGWSYPRVQIERALWSCQKLVYQHFQSDGLDNESYNTSLLFRFGNGVQMIGTNFIFSILSV